MVESKNYVFTFYEENGSQHQRLWYAISGQSEEDSIKDAFRFFYGNREFKKKESLKVQEVELIGNEKTYNGQFIAEIELKIG